jgi:molybdate transport system substrate-binding protein
MLRFAAIALAVIMSMTAGHAADVKVLAALAVQDALGPLAARFTREMDRAGELLAGTSAPVAATRTGLAIRAGAVAPDISTLDKFRAALLAAGSIAYTDPKTGGAFGSYFAKELERLGLLDAVNAKAVLRRGSHEIVKAVASGEAEA